MTANEKLQDEAITHALYLQGYTKGTAAKLLNLLKRTDADLVAQLAKQLEKLPQNQFNLARIDALLSSINDLIKSVYSEVSTELNSELKQLAKYETGFYSQLFASVLPEQVALIVVTGEQAYAAALARPFQGRLLKEWMAGLEVDAAIKIRDAVRLGYIESQTIAEIVKRIRGTKALNYADGLLDINRRNAETIVRTAIGHTAAYARDLSYDANDDIIKGIKWLSVLDARTTPICQLRDGKIYTDKTHKPIGHNLPWLSGPGRTHMNCRSTSAAVLKSFRELGFNMDDLPPGTRASLDGQIPSDTTYTEWLKSKPAAFQDEVLGKVKGKLYRDGGLTLDRFYAKDGQVYTLDELRSRDAGAFAQAGL